MVVDDTSEVDNGDETVTETEVSNDTEEGTGETQEN